MFENDVDQYGYLTTMALPVTDEGFENDVN